MPGLVGRNPRLSGREDSNGASARQISLTSQEGSDDTQVSIH